MDYKVLEAQQWVNRTYRGVSGYSPCVEDGMTGWSTIYCLTRGLQHELGITALSDNFGPTTMKLLTAAGPISARTPNKNLRIIVEAAMYCKGYTGGEIDGVFGDETQAGLVSWKNDMGFAASGKANSVSAKEMKALLTMDAYVLLPNGDPDVRAVQRWMNATFVGRLDYQIVPCDGVYSRGVQHGLVLALQYSLGMADGVADGLFGPVSRAGLKKATATLSVGRSDSGAAHYVRLFKAALIFNGQARVDWTSGTYTSVTASATIAFQSFCRLPTTGKGDYQTWCSLLVSTGDPDRKGTACDCMTPLNDARAKALRAAGYETVGRYIAGGTQKMLTASEIQVILKNKLSFFPIYQESNNSLLLFTKATGAQQGEAAHANALKLGIPRGAIIYFAVDFDATADEVRSNVIPYFQGIANSFEGLGSRYSVGVYGSRNICSMVCEAGYAISSFVGGISTGFSGNLGFPLPANWAFDQVKTTTVAPGAAGEIEIDNDIKSGRDRGISSLSKPIDQNAAFFTWVEWIEARAQEWVAKGHKGSTPQQLTAQYLRTYIDDRYDNATYDEYAGGVKWFDTVSGSVDNEFLRYCAQAKGRPDPGSLRCPATGYLLDIQHFGASLGSVFRHSVPTGRTKVSMADFGGWAGDLITADGEVYTSGVTAEEAYEYAFGKIGNGAEQGTFGAADLIADVDAMVIGLSIKARSDTPVSSALRSRYVTRGAAQIRYSEFVSARFGSVKNFEGGARSVMKPSNDPMFLTFRAGLWLRSSFVPIGVAMSKHGDMFAAAARALVDVVNKKFAS